MYSVARSSNFISADEDTFMFGILKQKYCYLEHISQASVQILVHSYLESITDIINITLLILRQFDVSLVSLFSWKRILNYNVTILPTVKPQILSRFLKRPVISSYLEPVENSLCSQTLFLEIPL